MCADYRNDLRLGCRFRQAGGHSADSRLARPQDIFRRPLSVHHQCQTDDHL
jgi:hypothetical protein